MQGINNSCYKSNSPGKFESARRNSIEYRASQYPQVYLDATLSDKITQANQYKSLSISHQSQKKRKRLSPNISKRPKTSKFFSLRSVDSSFLNKICSSNGCLCCKVRSLSYETDFEKLIEDKKIKTCKAQKDFKNLFKGIKRINPKQKMPSSRKPKQKKTLEKPKFSCKFLLLDYSKYFI